MEAEKNQNPSKENTLNNTEADLLQLKLSYCEKLLAQQQMVINVLLQNVSLLQNEVKRLYLFNSLKGNMPDKPVDVNSFQGIDTNKMFDVNYINQIDMNKMFDVNSINPIDTNKIIDVNSINTIDMNKMVDVNSLKGIDIKQPIPLNPLQGNVQNKPVFNDGRKVMPPVKDIPGISMRVFKNIQKQSIKPVRSDSMGNLVKQIIYLYDNARAPRAELVNLTGLSKDGFARQFLKLLHNGWVYRQKGFYYLSEKGKKLVEEDLA